MAFIVCDTDFLMKVTTEPLPQLAEFLANKGYKLATVSRIKDELNGLVLSRDGVTARKARAALRAISENHIELLAYSNNFSKKIDADAILIDFAANSNQRLVTATLDRTILAALEKKGLPYLTLRKNRPFFRDFESATYLFDKRSL